MIESSQARVGHPQTFILLGARLLLVLMAGSLALASCELLARYIFKAPPFEETEQLPSVLTSHDAVLKWRYSASGGRNRLGLQNREVSPKARNTYRILVLGDSMIFISDTSSGAFFTQVVEERLNERLASDHRSFEVINA